MSEINENTTPQGAPVPPFPPEEAPMDKLEGANPDAVQPDSENVGTGADGNPEKKEHTRSKMAILFVLGFFAILFLCFVYAIMVGAKLNELKDTLVGVIGALSGILGFIVGYYYKSSQEQ